MISRIWTILILFVLTCTGSVNAFAEKWALPCISVANMRSKPSHSAELASQALMGMPLKVLDRSGEWLHVESPEGYKAWMSRSSLVLKNDAEMKQWRNSDRVVISSVYQTRCYSTPASTDARDVVSDLVNGDIVQLAQSASVNDKVKITLPDGRAGWVLQSEVENIEAWANQDFDPQKIIDMAYSMQGQPYLWGGTSVKSVDCSGLVKVCYLANGIILRRNASQQAVTGMRIEPNDWQNCRTGDLLFFGNASTGKVTHVAIYDADGYYIHSSGRVKCNSVNPDHASYLSTSFLHAVRIDGCIGSAGIVKVGDHPWYFNL